MKITADTNVLARFLVRDDELQAQAAVKILRESEVVAIPLAGLCELVWVLRRLYRFERPQIATAINALLEMENVEVDQLAVEAGLKIFEAGADFADGVIAYEGHWLGGESFVSFDKKAVKLLTAQGQEAQLLT